MFSSIGFGLQRWSLSNHILLSHRDLDSVCDDVFLEAQNP